MVPDGRDPATPRPRDPATDATDATDPATDPATGNGVGASDGHREQTGVVARQWKASPGLPMLTTATAVLHDRHDSPDNDVTRD